jgi:predicted ATPase
MNTQRWQQVSQLYYAALAREGDCAAFLKQACAGDEELRLDLESLLAQLTSAETFLTPDASIATNVCSTEPELLKKGLADRYRIERELGRGGMAVVYLADDLKHGRKVAIKTIHAETAAAIAHERFLREIQIAARLTHPHILPLHDSGETNAQLYYVMPYIDGESLRVRLDREKQLPIGTAVRLTQEIASALEYAHQNGVVHRDIKPGNVLLAEGIAVVADFGIARALSASVESHQTATGVVVGTPYYMSPEQASGGANVDARSDLYSLGCVLYEMLTGEPPFTGPNAMMVLARHALEEMPPLKTKRPGISDELESVVRKSLAKSPADRYNTAALFAEALRAATAGPTVPRQRAKSEALVRDNLPKERTRFIGRETELSECALLLDETRLLTVTGIGGSGKTRLAVKLAASVRHNYPDGVWFVDLSPLREGSRVVEALAATLAVVEEPGKSLLETVGHHLNGKRLLLLLDNCEHLLDACASLVDALLNTVGDIRVLATSRERLGIDGERLIALGSLAVPSKACFDLDAVKGSEAVSLFVDRAQIVDSEFVLDTHSAPPVVEICGRLDGIPLAIELAAARVKMLSVEEIRSRLDDRFRLLTGGNKALPRHQTLRAAVQWSYDLLTAEEQRLFRLLTVFAGGWTLEAATAVWSDAADEFEVLELMTRLADKSLVKIERLASGTSRYRMLETFRQFAQEKLEEAGEGDVARERHLKYFVAWSEHREPMGRGAEQGEWLTEVEREHENVLLALEFCPRARSGAEQALGLIDDVYLYWSLRGLYGVARERLGAALRIPGAESPTPARAWALVCMGDLARQQGALSEAQVSFEESLTISRNAGDPRNIAQALYGLGMVSLRDNDQDAAQARFEEGLQLGRQLGQSKLVAIGLNNLAILALDRGDLAHARVLWYEALALARSLMDPCSVAVVLTNLTNVDLKSGRLHEARRNLNEMLRIVRDEGLRAYANTGLRRLSELAVKSGDARRGARWSGAAAALEHALGSNRQTDRERSTHAAILAPARETLGAPEFARVVSEGAALDYKEALAEAQAWLEDPTLPPQI